MENNQGQGNYDKFLQELSKSPLKQVVNLFLSGGYSVANGKELGEKIRVAKFIKESGYRFTEDELFILAKKAWLNPGWTYAHAMAREGYRFSFAELKAMGNPSDNFGETVAHIMAYKGWQFSFSEIMELGNPTMGTYETIAHAQLNYLWGYNVKIGKSEKRRLFSFDEMMQLEPEEKRATLLTSAKKIGYKGINSLAHRMAYHGFVYTFPQLQRLGDIPDHDGRTISLLMARLGHLFTFDEIHHLNNPVDEFGNTLAHWVARHGGRFTLDELLQLKNPKIKNDELEFGYEGYIVGNDIGHQFPLEFSHVGATVAHIMAREGYTFTDQEIKALGNPKDKAGLTIKDWMAQADPPETDETYSKPG